MGASRPGLLGWGEGGWREGGKVTQSPQGLGQVQPSIQARILPLRRDFWLPMGYCCHPRPSSTPQFSGSILAWASFGIWSLSKIRLCQQLAVGLCPTRPKPGARQPRPTQPSAHRVPGLHGLGGPSQASSSAPTPCFLIFLTLEFGLVTAASAPSVPSCHPLLITNKHPLYTGE